MPTLSRLGRLSLSGSVAMTLGGLLGAHAPLAGAGTSMLVGLAIAWVATLPIPRRMRRERLEFTWWIASHARGVKKPDQSIPLRVMIRNPTDEAVTLGVPRLSLSPGLAHTRASGLRVVVPPHSAARIDLEVIAKHAGRHVLHGAWMTIAGPLGLAWSPLYFPNPLAIEVQPRGAGELTTSRTKAEPEPSARAGATVRRHGEGPELRELRDHQPGDPFRRIAWKPSARRGRLLVRETEDDTQSTRMLIVDASASMRGDDGGRARIDYAIEMCAQAARLSASTGDRLGMVGFGSRVVSYVPPGLSALHARQLVTAAVDLRAMVDEDQTEVDDESLANTVARYFREQEGVDLAHGLHTLEGRARLAELAAQGVRADPLFLLPVQAKDPAMRVLRAFCRARAIALPLRADPTGTRKASGLAAALHRAADDARETRTILVFSDLDPLHDIEPVTRALARVRHNRHRVTVVAPIGDGFITEPAHKLNLATDALRSLLLSDEQQRLQEVRVHLARLGVPLYFARPEHGAAHWLRRAASGRVRAA